MNIGVVGANGFVGRNVVSSFRSIGMQVKGYGRDQVDLCRPESLANIGEHDVIINCAAYVGSAKDLLFSVNVQGVQHLCAELNLREKKPYLLHLSSGAVYGYSDAPASAESVVSPSGEYALSKYLGDEVVRLYYIGVSAVVRLYYPYGEGQSSDRLISRLVSRVLQREAVDISVHAARPLINPLYVGDLCDSLKSLVCSHAQGVHLLGGAEVVSVRDIAELIGKLVGIDPVFREYDGAASSMYCKGGSAVSLESGISRLIKSM